MCGSSSTTSTRRCSCRSAGEGSSSAPPPRSPRSPRPPASGLSSARTPAGSSTVNVAPRPLPAPPGCTEMLPPCSFTIPRQIDRPSPVPSPSDLVLKNGSNTRCATASGIPGPLSVMLTEMPSGSQRATSSIRPPPSLRRVLVIACAELLMMFTKTCLIWFACTSTSGSPGSKVNVSSMRAASSWFFKSWCVDSRIGRIDWSWRSPSCRRANERRLRTMGEARRHIRGFAQQIAEADDRRERVVEIVRDARNQLADRRHLLRLQQLVLETPLLSLILEQQHGGARLAGGNGGYQQCPLAGAHLHRRFARRRSQQARHGLHPRRREEGEPRSPGKGRDGELDQIGKYTIGATHRALRIHVANCLVECVDRLFPLTLAARQQLDESRVLEREPGLRQHGAREHQRALIEGVFAIAFERDRANGACDGNNRRAEPAGGYRSGPVEHDLELSGARGDVIPKDQGSAPERELQERLVGTRGTRSVVVGDGELVGIEIEQHHGETTGRQLFRQNPRDDLDNRGRTKGARELMGERGQSRQYVGDRTAHVPSSRNRVGTRVAASTSASADLMNRTTIGNDPCSATLRCMIPAMGPSSFLMICFQ